MRTITKPSEATPHDGQIPDLPIITKFRYSISYPVFTAAECAQIARAYAISCSRRIMLKMTQGKDFVTPADEWESLFNQWGSK